MSKIKSTNLIWGLISALALVIGIIAGRMGLVGQSPNAPSTANFRPDFALKQVHGKTFKNETVELDGNAFVDCRFDNVIFKFKGEAPFNFANDHFDSKFGVTSDNPAIKATIELM